METRPTAELSKPYPKGAGSSGGLGKLKMGIEKEKGRAGTD